VKILGTRAALERALICVLSLAAASCDAVPGGVWRTLDRGLELATIAPPRGAASSDDKITILRIDPALWDLELIGIGPTGEANARTAKDWARQHGLVAAINAGMFDVDARTHIGYLQSGSHAQGRRVPTYESVAAFDPRDGKELPRFRLYDLDEPGVSLDRILEDYDSVVQNLRLIKRPGENRWSPQERRWSEAALGEDRAGRALFLFSRSPVTMHEWNDALLAAGIDLVAAQHLEGGHKAQLFVDAGEVEVERFGEFEGGQGNVAAWPVPNVIGVKRRA
jgi:Phosphodiester glycosidase